MAKRKSQEPMGAIQILEEGAQLLRRAPLAAWAAYYLGSVPLSLGFLYFWADMSRSSQAYETLPQEAFVLALLFVWMKTWQSVFAQALWAHLAQGVQAPWTPGRIFRTALTQATIQPWGFLLLPAAALLTLPFAWVYAFFQNVTVLGEGERGSMKEARREAWRLSGIWPRQNNVMILSISFFGFFVLMNLAVTLMAGPHFLKSFLGVETVFSRSPWSLLNTTYFAVVWVLAYLCLDPLVKAVYTLRCFYGQALSDGQDLKVDLKAAALAKTFLFLALLSLTTAPSFAQSSATHLRQSSLPLGSAGQAAPVSPDKSETVSWVGTSREKQGVNPGELDKSITEVLRSEEYQWHLPRVAPPPRDKKSEPGLISQFLEGAFRLVGRILKKVGHWIVVALQWIADHLKFHPSSDRQVKSSEWNFEWLYLFLWALLAAAVCALALLVYRLWARREKPVILGEAVLPRPDVADEKVTGVELSSDGWLQMAQDLMRQGDFRLALRAFYLASLASLARQKLLTLAKSKSTLDYERELRRRGHSLPELLPVFSESGLLFDRGWYGGGDVTREMVQSFAMKHSEIQKAIRTQLGTESNS
jgi:hypothetical protein